MHKLVGESQLQRGYDCTVMHEERALAHAVLLPSNYPDRLGMGPAGEEAQECSG